MNWQRNSLYYAARIQANFEEILGFSVPSMIWVKAGLMQITMWRAHPAWLRMTLDCSRIAKVMAMVSGSRGRRCFILASDKNKKDQKNLRSRLSKLVDYYPIQVDHKSTNLEKRNKQNGLKSTNRESQTRTFWTRASTHVFPKRPA